MFCIKKVIMTLGFLVLSDLCLIVAGQTCNNITDCEKYFDDGTEFVVCEEGKCKCTDFFGVDTSNFPPFFACIKGVPIGKHCTRDLECEIPLGAGVSRCNAENKCECYDTLGRTTQEFEDRCYVVRALEEPCLDNKECILGSNEFARCVNGTCQCHSSQEAMFEPDAQGRCYVAEVENKTSLSVFAATLCISAVLFMTIIVIHICTRDANHDIVDEVQL